jgi:probable O-glycosylation ligase (exosortase A-associated)
LVVIGDRWLQRRGRRRAHGSTSVTAHVLADCPASPTHPDKHEHDVMRFAVYLLGLAILVPMILIRPWIGIPAWNFLGLVNPQTMVWSGADLPFALLVGGATLVGMLFTKHRSSIPAYPQTVLLALLVVWFTITTVFAWAPDSAWAQWDKVLKILLMTFAAIILIHGEYRIRTLLVTLALALGLLGVKGGLFTIATGGHHMVQGPGGFLRGNTPLGLALAMTLPLIATFAMEQRRVWLRWGIWGAFWLSVVATVFTYSRGALLGLGAVLFVMFLGLKRKLMIVLLLLPALIVAVGFVPDRLVNRAATIKTYEQDRSAMGRIQAWGVAWNVAKSRVVGGGFNLEYIDPAKWLSFADHEDLNDYKTIAAHSIYFQMLGDHGFVGLALFLGLIVTTWRGFSAVEQATRGKEGAEWMARHSWALRTGLIAYCVSGAFLSLAYFDLFYTYVALSIILRRESRNTLALPARRTDPGINAIGRTTGVPDHG